MTIIINKLSTADLERFKKIRLQSLSTNPEAFGSTYEVASSWDDDIWENQLKTLNTFIALDGDEDIGVARSVVDKDDPTKAWIISMWTAPKARGKSVASKLLEAIIKWAKEQELKSLLLDVVDSNTAAINLYKKFNFIETGISGSFPEPRAHITEHQRELKL